MCSTRWGCRSASRRARSASASGAERATTISSVSSRPSKRRQNAYIRGRTRHKLRRDINPAALETAQETEMPAVQETVDRVKAIDVDQYKWGFVTSVESDMAPQGLSEEVIRFISAKKEEPDWLLEWRLDAYRR